jgi:hypothetical protein
MLMKMTYNDKYSIVDENMSDSNVGARKGKNIRNHIFILNGVINEAVNQKKHGIDLQILDYKQCFDSLWIEECMNDLWEAGITDDKLGLIYKMNETTNVAVKTPFGFTETREVNRVVMQGETFGPLCCSVQVDTIGKECIEKNQLLFQYKGEVGVPPLAMVDDLVCISNCGLDSILMNAYINAKSNMKTCYCPKLYVDNWEAKMEDNVFTGEKVLIDELNGEHTMEESQTEKYLGDLISNDGKNDKIIKARKEKARGLWTKLFQYWRVLYLALSSLR